MFLYLISLLLLLPSCSSIYSDAPPIEPITKIEVDPNEEYFTLGTAIDRNCNMGCWYNDSWIYDEYQEYQECIRTKPDGEKIYVGRKVRRFVKYNPYTNTVSSPCLDPICTHGPGSGCIFIVPNEALPDIKGMIGDWFLFGYAYELSTELGFSSEVYAYNLSTGELIQLSDFDPSAKVISQPKNWCTFGNKKYVTIQVLDYTDTDYIHKGERNELDSYTPETKWYLWEMDFDTKKFPELFEVVGYAEENGVYRITKPSDDKVALFCHAGTGRILISHLLHIPLHLVWAGFNYNHTGVTVIEFKNQKTGFTVPRMLCYSDTSHLYAHGPDMKYCGRTEI